MKLPQPAYQGSDPSLFICYAHADVDLVYPEIARLQAEGFKIWYDEGIKPGSEWSSILAAAIEQCAVFLYFVTPNSVASEHCRREVNFALEQSCSMLAVHLVETDVPSALKLSLSHRQAIVRPNYPAARYEARLSDALRDELTGKPSSLSSEADVFEIGDCVLECGTQRLFRGDEATDLEPKELNVLLHLIEGAPDLVTTEALMDRSWPGAVVGDNALHQVIGRLRKAFGDDARNPRYIATLPRRGYRLVADVGVAGDQPTLEAASPQPVVSKDTVSKDKATWPRMPVALAVVALLTLVAVVGVGYLLPTNPPADTPSLTGVAVLPFDDLSPNGDQAWLANGMTEMLTDSLSRIGDLKIAGRLSTAAVKQQNATAQEIGERLKVGSVLVGSVSRVQEDVQISVQWLRASDEAVLWSARFARPFDAVFDLQQEIAAAVAEAIRSELGVKDAWGVLLGTRYVPADPRAWEAVARALQGQMTSTPEGYRQSVEPCKQAISLDPNYAQAYSCLAWAHYHWASPQRDVEKAIGLATKAVALDPTDVLGNNLLAYEEMFNWDYAAAEKRLGKLREARPNQIFTNGVYLPMLWSLGKHDEAIRLARQAVESEPLMPRVYGFLAYSLLFAGRYDEALQAYQAGVEGGGYTDNEHTLGAFLYHRTGRDYEALEAAVTGMQPLDDPQGKRDAYERDGWYGLIRFVIASFPPSQCSPMLLAMADEFESFYECVEGLIAAPRLNSMLVLSLEGGFSEEIQQTPRYQALARRFMAKLGSDYQATTPAFTDIAVLPFENLSDDDNQGWMSKAMAEVVGEMLSRIDGVRIPGITSTASLQERGSTIAEIGEQLDVGTVVEGSVTRTGDKIRVLAKLIRVSDEAHLWSGRYQRNFEDIFTVQQEIAAGIAEAIREELAIEDTFDHLMATRYESTDPRAWEFYKRAYELWATFDNSKIPESAEYCRRAIAIDPEYPPGYSCLAVTYGLSRSSTYDDDKAVELAQQALALDPYDENATFVMAYHHWKHWEFESAVKITSSTLEKRPRGLNVIAPYVDALIASGHLDQALQQAKNLAEFEPSFSQSQAYLARSLLITGDAKTAIDVYEKALAYGPIGTDHYVSLAAGYFQVGNQERGVDEIVRAYGPLLSEEQLRLAYAQDGKSGLYLYVAENITMPDGSSPCMAGFYGEAGATEQMYDCLETALAAEDAWLPMTVNLGLGFQAYRDEPEFLDFKRRLDARIRAKALAPEMAPE